MYLIFPYKLIDFIGLFIIKLDGEWSEWSPLSTCSKTCGGGIQTRTRTCSNAAPGNVSLPCTGNSTETLRCNNQACNNSKFYVLIRTKKSILLKQFLKVCKLFISFPDW
jgi:hypothetical protein